MSQKSNTTLWSPEEIVKGIRRATSKRYCAEDKIRIVLDGLRGEHLIAELCRHEGIAEGPLLQLVQGIPGSRQTPPHRHAGEGLNAGLMDAADLAWKLALVVRGRGRLLLLESYAIERSLADQHALTVSDLVHGKATTRTPDRP